MQMHISCTMSCCSTLLLPTAIAGRIYTFPFIIDPITVFQNVKMSLCEIIQKIPIRFNFRLDAFSTKCHLLPKAILFFTSYPSDQMYFWLNVIRPNVIRVNVIRPNVIESWKRAIYCLLCFEYHHIASTYVDIVRFLLKFFQ